MLTMSRNGDRNVVARKPVDHGLQVKQSVGCSKVQRCERANHLQSAMPSYSHSVSFVHQQKDGLEFGRKRYRFALACLEMCQSRIDGLFQAHYFQPLERLRNPRAHDSWRICMGQLGLHNGGDKNPSI